MAYDKAHLVTVLFGGCPSVDCSTGPWLNDLWYWDGHSWTNATPTSGQLPAPRAGAGMLYDAAHASVLLYGGIGGTDPTHPVQLGDLWQWDGSAWTSLTPSGAIPPARDGAAFVYEASIAASVLIGGNVVGQGPSSDVWIWDGSAWRNVAPTTAAPPGRSYFATVYDAAVLGLYVFGGCSTAGCGAPLADTWLWDNGAWSPRAVGGAGPGASAPGSGAMTFASSLSAAYMFGAAPAQSTWGWDGFTWTNRTPTVSPPARSRATMVFDASHAVNVMFGGAGATQPLGDTWEFDGFTWTNVTP